jgi:hypothetical protein
LTTFPEKPEKGLKKSRRWEQKEVIIIKSRSSHSKKGRLHGLGLWRGRREPQGKGGIIGLKG